jgi:hypothetical protein
VSTKPNVFDRINFYIRNSEASLVNLLSAIAPWGAPLAPASMAYIGMTDHLGIHRIIAGILAGVIEILGLATVHTTLSFWQYNRRRVAGWKRQPTELAAGMFGFYLLIILTVNVVLEIPGAYPAIDPRLSAGIPILAKALLSLLAVPAAVTMAVRALHTETQSGTSTGKMPEQNGIKRNIAERPESSEKFRWSDIPEEDRAIIATMTTGQIVSAYGVGDRAARNWRQKSRSKNNGRAKPGR